MRIAFLGLGHMGLPMARNLAAAGHEVVGFDVFQGAMDAAASGGLAVADSGPAAVRAASAEIVITMFQSGRQVLDAYNGVDGRYCASPRVGPSRKCRSIRGVKRSRYDNALRTCRNLRIRRGN